MDFNLGENTATLLPACTVGQTRSSVLRLVQVVKSVQQVYVAGWLGMQQHYRHVMNVNKAFLR
ncbi:MAG TPA: hypothetical protein VG962_00800 [Steroidobacteraceae bacterium]|nr:hypothetical protein [Steroidobacteraceae bacterium]